MYSVLIQNGVSKEASYTDLVKTLPYLLLKNAVRSCLRDVFLRRSNFIRTRVPQFYMRESSFPAAEVLANHKRLYMAGVIKALFESSAHLNSVPRRSFSESSSHEHS